MVLLMGTMLGLAIYLMLRDQLVAGAIVFGTMAVSCSILYVGSDVRAFLDRFQLEDSDAADTDVHGQ